MCLTALIEEEMRYATHLVWFTMMVENGGFYAHEKPNELIPQPNKYLPHLHETDVHIQYPH